MFARLLAAFCLLNLAVVCRAGSDDPANSELVIYLRADAGQSAHLIEIMKRELAPLMLTAGYRVEWRDSVAKFDSTAGNLVVVQLESARSDGMALASTAVTEDTVLPFSTIHCGVLSRVLGPMLSQEAGARREFLYGRAMARVLAHELYHVLAQTKDHDREGIAKPHFTFSDLVSERFDFEHTTLTKLARPAVEVVDSGDGGSGR